MTQGSSMALPVLGVTLAVFASGFGVCMFNMDTVGSCVDLANSWVGKFQMMGNHIIAWGLSIIQSVKH